MPRVENLGLGEAVAMVKWASLGEKTPHKREKWLFMAQKRAKRRKKCKKIPRRGREGREFGEIVLELEAIDERR